MAIYKCKICGGSLDIQPGESITTCEYCGTKQTLPRLDDEKRANLYDRANHFRRNNDYDKAMGIYETILNEDTTDAEAYWSILLCKYGIEYVEDPLTHKHMPTVNRTQYTSIFDDEDYKSALQYADEYQRELYEAEANSINKIQKEILAISQKEEPFDVFICYKETDSSGRRTQDSVLATELYHELTREGFKVFFSRITLEDKLGQEYEPYIFAALNSAKVMVVLGTKPEYFNAVWVKNEWNRYLSLIKNGARKALIPAYKNMDPYDLPDEFSHLQAQDMSKLGFMQDLIRGIKKLTQAEENKAASKETVVVNANTNISPLLKRAFMFLEDGDFDRADEFCEQVLNIDPECAEAYLGKLMAELNVRKQEDLANCEQSFENNNNYNRLLRFADDKLSKSLKGYILGINERNENARLEGIYAQAVRAMNSATTQTDFEQAAQAFESIESYKDSSDLAKECRDKAEANQLETERKTEEKRIANEEAIKKRKKTLVISAPIICVIIVFFVLVETAIIQPIHYNEGIEFSESGDYIKAIKAFSAARNYKDAAYKRKDCIIKNNRKTISTGNYFTVGLKSSGTVVAVGDNDSGQCDVLTWKDIAEISAGYNHTVGINMNGNVIAVGSNRDGQCNVSDWENIVSISAGYSHTVGLKSDGTVVSVGVNNLGQCDTSDWKDIITISSKHHHTVGVKTDGTVVATGRDIDGECNVSDWKDIVSISTGSYHTVGLKADGTVIAVGNNDYGQCDVSKWQDIVAISAGDEYTVGLKSDGTVVAVGCNLDGQCDILNWKDIVAISAGNHHTVGLKADGTVIATGRNYDGQCDILSWSNIQIK